MHSQVFNDKAKLQFVKSDSINNINKSSSSGDKLRKYYNYRLLDLISEVSEIPIEYFSMSGNAANPITNFELYSNSTIDKEELLAALIKSLKEENINIQFKDKLKEVYVASFGKEASLPYCDDIGVYNKIMLINKTWVGECVGLNLMLKQLNDWYNINVFNDFNDENKYNITLQRVNNFEELIRELKEYYGIVIKKGKKKVSTIKIEFAE